FGRDGELRGDGRSRALARELVARGVAEADVIYPGRERGAWKLDEPVARATFVRVYQDLQRYLRQATDAWVRAKSERTRDQRETLAYLALDRFRQERRDVTIDVERDPETGAIPWPKRDVPPAPVRRSTSLAGELALALYDELLSARSAGLCVQCRRPWVSRLRKPHRRLCGRDACEKTYRQAHRKPEDPAKARARVKRWRARKRGEAQRGQSRKR
ncbi:MAG: hypothetical protein M3470_10905, partial [Chloroflexota bacterium]|nr:hypothetical protein [Chloroflexota bacterium]